eukprot:9467702-Ditylum_brightwellii.AAC.1
MSHPESGLKYKKLLMSTEILYQDQMKSSIADGKRVLETHDIVDVEGNGHCAYLGILVHLLHSGHVENTDVIVF